MIFAMSSRCDTSRHSAQLWNSKSPECRATSSSREAPGTLVRPCIQNAPRKTGEASPAGYTHGKRPRGRRRTSWIDCISDFAWFHFRERSEVANCRCRIFKSNLQTIAFRVYKTIFRFASRWTENFRKFFSQQPFYDNCEQPSNDHFEAFGSPST